MNPLKWGFFEFNLRYPDIWVSLVKTKTKEARLMATANFPKKYIRADSGSLLIKLHINTLQSTVNFLSVGGYSLRYEEGAYQLVHLTKRIRISRPMKTGYLTLVWSWEGSLHRLILQDSAGLAYVTSTNSWAPMVSDTIQLVNTPLFQGDYMAIETSITELASYDLADITKVVARYMVKEQDSQLIERNHAFSDLLESDSLLFQRDFRTTNIRYKQKPFLEATQAPTDQSPILMKDEEGPLHRQYFFDLESSEYTTSNTEYFELDQRGWFDLSYDNIDISFNPIIYIRGELMTNFLLEGHRITLLLEDWQRRVWFGETIEVTYKLMRSYTVEWNENAAHDSYIVKMTDDDLRPVTITQEGNRFSTVKLATEIELNPIVNSQHTGFLYIDQEEQIAQAFRLNVSSNFLLLDGKDSADFIVEIIDQHGNEILSPYIDVFISDEHNTRRSEYGSIVPIITEDTLHARNAAGRCYFRYRTALVDSQVNYKEQLFLVAYDRRSGLGAQVALRIRMPLIQTQDSYSVRFAQEGISAAILPFEYFARFYGRKLPTNHPMVACDTDGDGILTRTDWLSFNRKIHDLSFLETLSNELKTYETL